MASMEGVIRNAIFEQYGMYNVLSYEESENRGYLTFTCGQGTYIAVMAKNGSSDGVWYYKYEKRGVIGND